MKKTNRILIGLLLTLSVSFFTLFGLSIRNVSADTVDYITFTEELKQQYVKGDTVYFPKPIENKDYVILVEKIEGDVVSLKSEIHDLLGAKYLFDETGEYIVSYVYGVNDSKTSNTNFNITITEEKNGFDFSAFPKKMNINEKIEFGSIYYHYDGIRKICEVSAVDNNNRSIDVSNGVFKPQNIGKYTITAKTKISGKTQRENFVITVVAQTNSLFKSDVFEVYSDYDLPSWSPEGTGVLLTTDKSMVSVRYANIIDLRTLPKETSLIKFQAMYGYDPVTGYTFSAMGSRTQVINENLLVKITDIYDPSKSVTISWRSGEYWIRPTDEWTKCLSYISTAPGEYTLPVWVDANGDGETEHVYSSFLGAEGKEYGPNNLFEISYDYATNSTYYNNGSTLCANYTDTDMYGKYAFDCFTTGEVYLDICFGKYPDARPGRGGIVVTEIAGTSLSGKVLTNLDDLDASTVHDTKAPAINIDIDRAYAENMPAGKVGTKYTIPNAYAHDAFCGECATYATVMFNSKKYDISEGAFIPDSVGTYIINYSSMDAFGNIALESLSVEIKENIDMITFTFGEPIVPSVGRYVDFGSLRVDGGTGKVSYSYDIYYNGAKIELSNDFKLFFDKTGTVRIVFKAEDYIGTQISNALLEYEIAETEEVFFDIDGFIPEYVQRGSTLNIPEFETICYKSGSDVQKKLLINGVAFDGNKYVVSENIGETVVLTYYAKNGTKEYTKEYNIEVVAPYNSVSGAFITDNTSYVLTDDSLKFTCNDDSSFKPFNPVLAEEFVLTFKAKFKDFDNIELIFKDVESSSTIIFSLYLDEKTNKINVAVNNSATYIVSPELVDENVYTITLKCNFATGRITNGSDILVCYVKDFSNGAVFTGFSYGVMYTAVNINGCNKTTEFYLSKFANQTFTKFTDRVAIGPQIHVENAMASQDVEKNSTIIIPTAVGYDLFDGICSAEVLVENPAGEVLISAPCTQENSFKADLVGTYHVTITSTDKHRGEGSLEYWYFVSDNEPPVISVVGNTLRARKGKDFSIPSATAKDNVSDVEIKVFIVGSDGRYIPVGKSYKFDTTGEYSIVYIAIDDQDNITRKAVKVIVSE